jgi:flavin-dependent dehydrogenase
LRFSNSLKNLTTYDIAIIGGGLSGLSLAIQSARAGYRTILLEKEQYPFHRVCGEYISLESWNFLEDLGVPLSDLNLPIIKKLIVTAPNGKSLTHDLPLGGFGISRHKLDSMLATIAQKNGVQVLDATKVQELAFENEIFTIHCSPSNKAADIFTVKSRVVCGSFGKRSNLDIKWKRDFVQKKPNKLNNYIGVKYHIQSNHPEDTIALHNFRNGYCGISKIEDNRYCLCYLTTAGELEKAGNSIKQLETEFLYRNPYLKNIFIHSQFLLNEPVIISQVSFDRKSLVENHVLMVGDAAGMITPLCGNGMSMALHGSKIYFHWLQQFFDEKISRSEMENGYMQEWHKHFNTRLQTGRLVQGLFGKELMTNIFLYTIKPFPKFISYLIRKTHGQPF